jgi:hypothetical protein
MRGHRLPNVRRGNPKTGYPEISPAKLKAESAAGYPGLAVISSEEARSEAEIATVCTSLKRRLHAWSSSEGLVDTKEGRVTACPDPLNALQLLDGMFAADSPRHVVLFRDLQLHMDQSDPMLVRRIKDILRVAKGNGHSIILLGCRLKLPAELEQEITHVDFSLPDNSQLGIVLDGILKSAKLKAPNAAIREAALQSALGLTTTEAENAFALSIIETKSIDHKVVAREKARTLKKNGLIEVVEATTSLDDIGGLGLLKEWLMRQGGTFGASAKAYGLPVPPNACSSSASPALANRSPRRLLPERSASPCCVSTWDAYSVGSSASRKPTCDPSSKPQRPLRPACYGSMKSKRASPAVSPAAAPMAALPPGCSARS